MVLSIIIPTYNEAGLFEIQSNFRQFSNQKTLKLLFLMHGSIRSNCRYR
jgi:hypothetical protein